MALSASIQRWTGLPWSQQGPALMVGVGHGATHWVAATFYLLLPWIKETLQISYTNAGILVAVFHLASFLANFASGALTDITGKRVLIQSGSLTLGALALGGTSLAWSVIPLALMIAIIGATNNAWHPAAISFLSERYPDNRGYALAVHALGANVGDSIAPLMVGAVLGMLSWQDTALVSPVPVFVVAFWIWTVLSRHETISPAETKETRKVPYLSELKIMFRQFELLGLSMMSGFRAAAQVGLLMFVPLYLTDVLEAGPMMTGVGFSLMQLGGVLSSPVAGAWSDRIGRRPIVVGGLALSTLFIAFLAIAGSQILFVSGIAFLGFVLYGVRPVVHSWALDLTSKTMGGTVISLVFGTQSLFSIGIPVLSGMVADLFGLQRVFWLLAGLILVSNLIAFFLKDSRN
ncbi:MAG: MFS transporter [SAR324 cluster bacterium]|nr:MFS transporter [SAR324 cluster bacterium]